VKAFELNAVDYLLKPFDQERLQKSIERVRERLAGQGQAKVAVQLQALLEERDRTLPDRLVVRE
jgi:two-component system LytT family response regulator